METDGKPFQVRTGRPARKDAIPRMPHERDESDDSQESGPREDMQQAYDDLESGLVDTDMRGVHHEEQVNGPDVTARGNAPKKER